MNGFTGLNAYHIVFALKNSRYEFQLIKRKKTAGFIMLIFPTLEGKEEEILIEVLCNVAEELNLELSAFNFCGDHVHCIMIVKEADISKTMLLWKGKSSYTFKRHPDHVKECGNNNDSEGLWAKSFFQKQIKNETELQNTISYIKFNRLKHQLKPLSQYSLTHIKEIIS